MSEEYEQITLDDRVIMPDPLPSDDYFIGGWDGYVIDIIEESGEAVVEDGEGELHIIELHRLKKATDKLKTDNLQTEKEIE